MAVCLPKVNREKLLNALKKGELTLGRLYELSDAQRNQLLSKYVGKENASFVNAKFEQAMLSNQKTAFAKWIENTVSRKDPVRRDMLKKVENVKKFLSPQERKGFLEDLAEMKLGVRVSEMEAKFLLETKAKIDEFKAKIPENAPLRSPERMAYGLAVETFKEFIGERKLAAEAITFKERFLPKNYWQNLVDVAGATKALVATLDNSFIGRQGIKVLYTNPKIWGRVAVESIKNFGKELFAKSEGFFKTRDDAIIQGIRADIWSRPNSLNGKYNAAKNGYGLGVLREEVFPTSIPEKIPILGRFFKASETAFNGSALRMRADLADAVIATAERNGVVMLDPRQATAHGRIVSSMTGRGEIGKLGAIGKEINVLMFAVRFLKSNFDTLTAHLFDKEFTVQARKTAAMNTLRIAASIHAILAVADALGADVEWDPRSSKYGQICKGNNCFDITGGMRGLVTLGARIMPTMHDGEWGFWSKSATTGKWTKMTGDKFGERTALDTVESFFEGKLSPALGMIRDIWRGEKFGGEKPTVVNSTIGLITPISIQTLVDELEKGSSDLLLVMIAEALGISPTDFTFRGQGKKWEALKEKKGEQIFNESLKQVQDRFNERTERLEESFRWEKMDFEERNKELDKIRREETERVFRRYGIQ